MHVDSLEELVTKHVETGISLQWHLISSTYEYQMGACVSPVLKYPALGDKSKDHFQALDNPLFSLDQI